jgi:hypothetical protein
MKRILMLLVLAIPATAWGVPQCPTEGDDLRERIEEAQLGVRSDRDWKAQSGAGAGTAQREFSYEPAAAGRHGRRGWQFSFVPLFWAPGVSGDIATGGQSVDVDASIADVLEGTFENFEFAAMGHFEARCGKWGILTNVVYSEIGNEDTIGVAAPIDLEWDFRMVFIDLLGAYRFAEIPLGCAGPCFQPMLRLDALAGLRYCSFATDIELEPGPDVDDSTDWIDPIVGIRTLFQVTPSLTFSVNANVGGFGIGSEFAWQLIAGVDYALNRCFSLNAGWAILSFDYEDGSKEFDLTLSGPFLGATFRF